MSFGRAAGPLGRPPNFSPYAASSPSSSAPPDSLQTAISPDGSPQRLLPSPGYADGQEQTSSSPPKFAGTSLSKRSRSPAENSSGRLTGSSLGPDDWRGVDYAKKTKYPVISLENRFPAQFLGQGIGESQRPIVSPPIASGRPMFPNNVTTSQANQKASPTALLSTPDLEQVPQGKSLNGNIQKREKSPPLLSSQLSPQSNKYFAHDDPEREALAKAKRLVRFNKELSEPLKELKKENISGKRQEEIKDEAQKVNIESLNEDTVNGSTHGDQEGPKPCKVVGLCLDMCPESEREERERKGDLDKYERLDGDRNQTSKYLAVKKYNRMAEREANLIRPMSVLKMTIEYLVGLLDQPYSGNFLGIYNFLWDRLRAIRMDLRMQHLFDQGAITMLEQMIRLHVIAMHELCEHAKGEGFSDGFDAHLNIEQMNKTSVELFQMYDDHSKKGLFVSTEKEFRGYYALLKLDKHPGYKVEPAELSLDLAKMSSLVRGSTEVLFARQVARACRTGNFIAFFRLAKKASYLQACLMHAHFTKLRSQALASLYSGLQSSQGIPIPQIVNWLAMEGEDIESLLEYHGFAIKMYDVPYMVKEGPFLNSDREFPNKCSHLVHSKKSRRIVDDVLGSNIQLLPSGLRNSMMVDNDNQIATAVIEDKTSINIDDEEMHISDEIVCGKESKVWLAPDVSSPPVLQHGKADTQIAKADTQIAKVMPFQESPAQFSLQAANRGVTETYKDTSFPVTEKISFPIISSLPQSFKVWSSPIDIQSLHVPGKEMGIELPSPKIQRKAYESFPVEMTAASNEGKTVEAVPVEKDEVAEAKLKLMIRIWRRRSKEQRELREQRQLAAVAAINALSLGPPLLQNTAQVVYPGELNIDHMMNERACRQGRASLRLNVAEVVGEILSVSNPKCKCFCWKLVVCSQLEDTLTGKWLHSKLLATPKEDDEELILSSSDFSIWKKLFPNQQGNFYHCCLSIVRSFCFDKHSLADIKAIIAGASSLLFIISENLPWELQKVKLHRFVQSLPMGSGLPLLILVCGMPEGMDSSSHSIAARLALNDVEKNRIKSFFIIPLFNQSPIKANASLDDDCLKNGLKWLADQSPQQPLLQQVQLRELVLRNLRFLLGKLDKLDFLSPKQCVDMFNEALNQSAEEIKTATYNNYVVWPCPEIGLLKVGSEERRFVDLYLPSVDWGSASNIVSTVGKLMACKLPSFPDDLSSLNQGADTVKDVENQKISLQRRLIWYLTGVSKLLPVDMAEREVHIMIQKGSFLKSNGFKYSIIPRWAMIFQRIYNWQLENLVGGEASSAYVLEDATKNGLAACQKSCSLDSVERNGRASDAEDCYSVYHLADVSLDEMLSVGCELPIRHNQNKLILDSNIIDDQEGDANGTPANDWHSDRESPRMNVVDETMNYEISERQTEQNSGSVSTLAGCDRFSILLAQCAMVQSRTQDKLFYYF